MGNSACIVHEADSDPIPFFGDSITFKAHHVGWLICGFFTIVSTITSFWLIYHHLGYYTNKKQQRHIVRLLFMVPIYAVVSFASYVDYKNALYYELCRDCYESFVVASFFYLLLAYLGPTDDEQRAVFRYKKLEKWMWPMGWVKTKPSTGLHFLQMMKWFIMQYVFIRPASTLAAVITQAMGLYCVSSYALVWSHIYIALAISISVTIAMYAVVQLYVMISVELKPYSPVAKFLCIKSVVFLTFWQASALAVLSSFDVIHGTKYMTADDILVGLNALLETFEMMIFAFLHIKAFSYRPYRPEDRTQTTPRFRSLMHAMDFSDLWVETSVGSVYLWKKLRGQQPDGPNRDDDFLAITGKSRGPLAHRSSLTAAELAKRRAGETEKFGVGDDGTDGEWDAGSDASEDEGGQRRKEMTGVKDDRTTYEHRQKRIRASLPISPAIVPHVLPYNNPDVPYSTSPTFEPMVDESLARRLSAAATSPRREPEHPSFRPPTSSRRASSPPRSTRSSLPPSMRSSLPPANQNLPDDSPLPEPRPVVLQRYESPTPTELDRQRFGYSQRDLNPPRSSTSRSPPTSPPAVESSSASGGGGWFSWALGRGGRRSESVSSSPGREERGDGLTPAPPSVSRRGRRAGPYEGVRIDEETYTHREERPRSSLPSDALLGVNRQPVSPSASPMVAGRSSASPPAVGRPTSLRLHISSPTHILSLPLDSPRSSTSRESLPSSASRDPRLYLSEQSPLERLSFIGSIRSQHSLLGPPPSSSSPTGPNFILSSSPRQQRASITPERSNVYSPSGTSFQTARVDPYSPPPLLAAHAYPIEEERRYSAVQQPRSASPTNRFSLPAPSRLSYDQYKRPSLDSTSSRRTSDSYATHEQARPLIHPTNSPYNPSQSRPPKMSHRPSQPPPSAQQYRPPTRLVPRQIVTPTPLSPARYPYEQHQQMAAAFPRPLLDSSNQAVLPSRRSPLLGTGLSRCTTRKPDDLKKGCKS